MTEDTRDELIQDGDDESEGGLYGFLLDGDGQELYRLAGDSGVADEIRLVRMKIGLAVKGGNDPELREWLDLFVRLRNVEARLGGMDEYDDDYVAHWEGGRSADGDGTNTSERPDTQ